MRTIGFKTEKRDRGYLSHVETAGSTYFITFSACGREGFSPEERALIMESVKFGHPARWLLHGAVVMPDHVHVLITPVEVKGCAGEDTRAPNQNDGARAPNQNDGARAPNQNDGARATNGKEQRFLSIAEIVKGIKSFSARKINKVRGRKSGSIWLAEYYDRIVRDQEDFNVKIEYMKNNPIKRGLVSDWKDWPDLYIEHEQEIMK